MSDISQHWTDDAACKNHDPELWFPIEFFKTKNRKFTNHVIDAIEICMSCPVQKKCFDYARMSGQKHGIWGGRIFSPVKM
jgi:WhiB family redox-sensing transcriptional regulator